MISPWNIIFDTQYFVRIRFNFEHKELQSIEKLVKKNYVKVYLTDITIREVIKKITDQTRAAIEKINTRELSILSIIPEFARVQAAHTEGSIAKIHKAKLDDFLKRCKVEIISSGGIDFMRIFEDYCNIVPPFNNKQDKKAEFPDAFALAAISDWAQKTKQSA